MPKERIFVAFGALWMLVGLVQAWRPEEAARTSDKYTPRAFRPDWSNDLWLVRLVGIVAALAGLGLLIAGLRSA